jgi:hypothetical protein
MVLDFAYRVVLRKENVSALKCFPYSREKLESYQSMVLYITKHFNKVPGTLGPIETVIHSFYRADVKNSFASRSSYLKTHTHPVSEALGV